MNLARSVGIVRQDHLGYQTLSETIREHVLRAFAVKADGEAKLAADRREAAAKAGVVRGPYAKEGRWHTTLDALTAVPRNVSTTLRQWVFEFRLGLAPFSLAG